MSISVSRRTDIPAFYGECFSVIEVGETVCFYSKVEAEKAQSKGKTVVL